MTCKDVRPFKIVNNILIGDEVPINESEHVGDLILNAFKSRPDFIGQVDAMTEKQTSYQQMREKSVKCALWLKRQGVKPGDIVVLCTHNQLDAYIPFFATLYINAIINPWNGQSTKFTIEYFLEQITPKIIFVNSDKAAVIQEVARKLDISTKIIVFDEAEEFESLESILNEHFDESEIDRFTCTKLESIKDTALIMFSSGTTNLPKSIKIPHIIFTSPSNQKLPAIFDGDVGMWFASLAWITSVVLTVRCVLNYSTAIKFSGFEIKKMYQLIEKYKVNWILIETSMCNHILNNDYFAKYDFSSLKRILVGGSPIKHEVHKNVTKLLPNVSILIGYGMTEATSLCYQRSKGKIGSTGYVAENVRLMFTDLDTGKPLGPNRHGEIWCKCPTLMSGYYNCSENITNPIDSEGWFHTGDIGYYDEDGDIFIVERISQLIKCRGNHVSSLEIENLLQSHPAVLEAVVMPVPHHLDMQHPIAFVTKVPGTKVTEEELKNLVKENLEDYKQLYAGVVFMENLPRVPNGKIDRKLLRNYAKSYVNE